MQLGAEQLGCGRLGFGGPGDRLVAARPLVHQLLSDAPKVVHGTLPIGQVQMIKGVGAMARPLALPLLRRGPSSVGASGIRRSFFSRPSNTLLLHSDGSVRQVLYTGPMNALMSRIKLASVLGAGGGCLGAPLALYYFGSEHWSLPSSAFAVALGTHPYNCPSRRVTDPLACNDDSGCGIRGTNVGRKPSPKAIRSAG